MSAQLAAFKVPTIENEPLVHPQCLNPVVSNRISLSFAEILRASFPRACGSAGCNRADGAGTSLRGPSHHKRGAGESRTLYGFVDSH